MSDPSRQQAPRSGGGNTATVAKLLGGEQNAGLIQNIITVLGFMSLSVEVFLRRDFGERYLSVIRFILAWVIFSFFTYGGQVLAGLPFIGRTGSASAAREAAAGVLFFQVLYWGFVALGFYHLWRTFRRNRKGERWYSYSFGVSHFNGLAGLKVGPFAVDDWALFRFIEPLFIFILAAVAGSISGTASGWLWLAGFTLLIKNNYLYAQERGRVLDMMDAEIQRDYYKRALKGEDKRSTAGFTMVRPPVAIDRDRDGIPDPLQGEEQRPDFGDVMAETFGERPSGERSQAEPEETPPIVTPPPRPDFGDVMADTFGEPHREGERHQDDPRPFDAAVPPSAIGTAPAAPRVEMPGAVADEQPRPAASVLARYAPLAAFALLLVLLGVVALASPPPPQAGQLAGTGAQPGVAGDTAPGSVPTRTPRLIPTSNGTSDAVGFEPPRAATTVSAGVAQSEPTVQTTVTAAVAPVATIAEVVPAGDAAAATPPTTGLFYPVAQEPQSTLRVLYFQQTETAAFVTVQYTPADNRKVGIDVPGGPNAFYLLSGGQRYALTSAQGIAVGSTSQSVTVGDPLTFVLTFEPLPDPLQPFDLIEGEHSASESASYWDILGVQLQAPR